MVLKVIVSAYITVFFNNYILVILVEIICCYVILIFNITYELLIKFLVIIRSSFIGI